MRSLSIRAALLSFVVLAPLVACTSTDDDVAATSHETGVTAAPVDPPRVRSEILPTGVATENPRLTLRLEQTWAGKDRVRFDPTLETVSWARDGVLRIGQGRETRLVDARTGAPVEPAATAPARRPDGRVAGLAKLAEVDEAAARRLLREAQRQGGTTLVARGKALLMHREGKWTRVPFPGGTELQLSPGGGRVAYARGGDLFATDLRTGQELRFTTDGGERYLNGRLDWVYQEEVYGRGRWRAHWWSPEGNFLAFLRLDQQGVPEFPLTDLRRRIPRARTMRYPKAGETNPKATLQVIQPGGEIRSVVFPRTPADALIVRVAWHPTNGTLLAAVQNRIQTWLDLWSIDPATMKATRMLRETSESWVDVTGMPRWLPDGRFLWLSDQSGLRHVELRQADGKLVRDLSPGIGVRGIVRVDAAEGRLFVRGFDDDPTGEHLYRLSFDGAAPVRLTAAPGRHRTTLSADGSLLIDRHDAVDDPGRVNVVDATTGEILRTVTTASILNEATYEFVRPTRHRVPTRDGRELDALVWRPTTEAPESGHPVWISTYSGPNAPSVRNRWNGDPWTQFLVQQGLIVAQVNVRSASGRGRIDTSACYQRLGEVELMDLVDTVDWLTANPWADAERVGLTGWSYGGFMTAFALTKSDRFRLGVAGAGVYDWRLYDTIYTERFMRTPQQNPDGYARTSVIAAAKDLSGHLVVVHGTQDDNVHVQNAIQLANALQQAEKSFDLMLYPGSGHGLRTPQQRRHLRRLTWDAIQEHLLDGVR